MGRKLYKKVVYKALASTEEQATLSIGTKVDRPYRSDLVVENYTKGTAATAQDLTATTDKLEINKQKTILMYVDDVDKIQNKWSAAKLWAEEAAERLAVAIDAEFLYEVTNAGDTIDDGDLGGTAGNPIAVSVSNISNIIAKINRKLDQNNVDMERANRFMVLSPQFYDFLWSYIAGKETLLGDKTGEFGNMGRYGGLELFMSNNLTASAVWTPADNPADEATITISGVVFTFQSVIGTTAGNVLQTTSTAVTLDNLVDLINNPTSSTANHVAFTGADLRTVQQMVAVDGATYVTVYHKGQSYLTVASSEALDLWSNETQHCLAGVKKAIDLVIQLNPDVEMASTVSAGKRGMNIMPMTIFGVKTFNQGTNEILDVQLDSSGY
uniref:Putative coat protein n=1 Tax=viral metagenome TaxID=1070528 RepID=A0A6H1ZD01_9ZZZZ